MTHTTNCRQSIKAFTKLISVPLRKYNALLIFQWPLQLQLHSNRSMISHDTLASLPNLAAISNGLLSLVFIDAVWQTHPNNIEILDDIATVLSRDIFVQPIQSADNATASIWKPFENCNKTFDTFAVDSALVTKSLKSSLLYTVPFTGSTVYVDIPGIPHRSNLAHRLFRSCKHHHLLVS